MSKKMCDDDKKSKKEDKKEARFECKKCGAKARKEKNLCKPDKL